MGKGSSSPSPPPTQQVTTQQSLPAYAQPYYQQIMGQGQALAQNAYTPYTGQLVQPFVGQQQEAFADASNLPSTYQGNLNQANQNFASATDIGNAATGFQPGHINAQTVGTGAFTDPGVAQSYMNPYVQASLEPQLKLLQQQTGIAQTNLGEQAAQQGAFGGYRQGIQGALTQQAADLAAQQMIGSGFNTAFQNAGQLYGTDTARQLQAQQANQQANLQAQQATEQARQAAENIGLQGANINLQAGQGQTWLGSTAQRAGLGDMQALLQTGALQQQMGQTGLNTAYQQFLNQLYFPYQQLQFEAGLMSGVPAGMTQQSSQFQNPNPTSQLLGLGLGAAGLYGMMGGIA